MVAAVGYEPMPLKSGLQTYPLGYLAEQTVERQSWIFTPSLPDKKDWHQKHDWEVAYASSLFQCQSHWDPDNDKKIYKSINK